MSPKKVAFIFGTRPEAIKLAPLIRVFRQHPTIFTTSVVVTAQQREMLDQVINLFRIRPDYDLNIMTPDQTLSLVTSRAVAGLENIMAKESPDLVIVQGDTTTTFVGALAAFHYKVPVVHVEAGLRTGDRLRPFPEEMNRRLTSVLADLHFVATEEARENLLREGISPKTIWVTGNTVVDALFWIFEQPYQFSPDLARLFQRGRARRILVTVHRRESHGAPMRGICDAILDVIHAVPDVEVIFPVHPNPKVRREVTSLLRGNERIHLVPPLDYRAFVHVMQRVYLILTDSGGIQEEAP